jgi:hypothetical protein
MSVLFDLEERGAKVSADGRYRYSLWRRWDPSLPMACFVMLNPSTADAAVDDPTIRKCVGFGRRWGAGGIRVVNLYPWRATKPRDLPAGIEVGGDPDEHQMAGSNDLAILAAVGDAGWTVVAWGANTGPWPMQRAHVLNLIVREGRPVDERVIHCLGLCKDGSPRHPLMVAYATPLEVYR